MASDKQAIERVKRLNNLSASISTEPIDHDKLFNRDEANQHPISAITNLEAVITELRGSNEYIGELDTVEVGNEQVALTMFVLDQRKRTPRLNDIVRINDRSELWRYNSEAWEHYHGSGGDIPLASNEVIGGVKLDEQKFKLDESGYLSYDITSEEAHQNLVERIDTLSNDIDSKISIVVNAKTHYDFPSVGRVDAIYKAEDEKIVYQWNPTELKYEQLNTVSGEVLDINLINGGNANG